MEVSPPQFCVVQQELEEPIFAQEKPGLSSKAHTTAGLKVRKVSGTPVRSLSFKRNRLGLRIGERSAGGQDPGRDREHRPMRALQTTF